MTRGCANTRVGCSRPTCQRDAQTRGMCEQHYRRRVRMGHFRYRPAAPVREHVDGLRALGWTWQQTADAAGVSAWVAYHVSTGRTHQVLTESRDALLAVPLVPRESHRGVDSTGTRRRVQALAWMGWPVREVAAMAGTTAATLRTLILPTRRPSYSLARRVVDVYERISHVPGPSRITAGKARGLGFAPPLAWDDETIDDPKARPAGVRRSA